MEKQPSEEVKNLAKMTFRDTLHSFLSNVNTVGRDYLGYMEYMWSQRDKPEILLVFFEDIIMVSWCVTCCNMRAEQCQKLLKISFEMFRLLGDDVTVNWVQ